MPMVSRPRVRRPDSISGRIRLVVADRQAIDCHGLAALLAQQRDFLVVGRAGSVQDAIESCLNQRAHVLVLTLSTPSDDPVPAVSSIRAALPRLRIVVVSERGVQECVVLNPPVSDDGPALACPSGTDCLRLAIALGASAAVRRDADPVVLIEAVRSAHRGAASNGSPTSALDSEIGAPSPSLSRRELEVARLIARGRSNKEIATELCISEPTVKKHVGHLLAKLKLQDRLQAGLFIARHPLLFRSYLLR